MLKLHLVILLTIPTYQVLAYRAFSNGKATQSTQSCYCKKVDSEEDCYRHSIENHYYEYSKRIRRFYRPDDGMCCKVKCYVDAMESMKLKLSGYKKVDMEMCQETYEVPAESCCKVDFGKWYTFGLHIKKAITKHIDERLCSNHKTLPTFEMDDITGGGEADQPWSVDDVRYLVTTMKREYPKAKLHCNKDMHEVKKDRDCKLFEKKPFLSSGCCCPLADVAHPKQCFRVAGASKERVIRQEHWITKKDDHWYYTPHQAPYTRVKTYKDAEDVPHDDIKDQDANMPAELVHADPKENELPEFVVAGKKWTWMKVEDQYTSKCLKRIQKKPYIAFVKIGKHEYYDQRYGAPSCPRVQYTRICPPGEGLYMKKNIPDGKCLWSHENSTEEMQLKFKPQYPSECPRGYTFGNNDWPGVEAAKCQCSNRTINLGNCKETICDFD